MTRIRIKPVAQKVSFDHERTVLIRVLENIKTYADTGIIREKRVTVTMEKCYY